MEQTTREAKVRPSKGASWTPETYTVLQLKFRLGLSQSERKQNKQTTTKKPMPKPLRIFLWVIIESWVVATCVCLGTGFEVDGFLEDTEWVLCDSCEVCMPSASHCKGSHSVCFFHYVMSSFLNVLAIAKSEGMWQSWPGSMLLWLRKALMLLALNVIISAGSVILFT